MSEEYDKYLEEHCKNVHEAFIWLRTRIFTEPERTPALREALLKASRSISKHDGSKRHPDEYTMYDAYFYGEYKEDTIVKIKFRQAWLHHIHHNPHHWEHWVLVNDDSEHRTIAIEMPYHQIIEMICDWWSFGWAADDLYEIFYWYDKNKNNMILHDKTRRQVEDILDRMKVELDKESFDVFAGHNSHQFV